MNCEIINVGTELLLGQNVNTNARDIGEKLAAAGIECYFQTSVGDNLARIVDAIKTAADRADAIIITGGLGSTDDDLTRQAVAEALGVELVSDTGLTRVIENRIREMEKAPTDKVMRQALIPKGATAILPTLGTAGGFVIDGSNAVIATTPGVPAEMLRMLDSDIIPAFRAHLREEGSVIVSRVLKVYGMREIEVEKAVQDIIDEQSNPTVAPLIARGAVTLRISAKADSRAAAETLIARTEDRVRERLGIAVFGIDTEEMEDITGALLKETGHGIALAESITGGLVVSRLVNTPGSSAYVTGGVVAYDNEVKRSVLGVSAQSLLNHGAVSAQVAEEMAMGVRRVLNADIGLSTTGIAGPEGGSQDKPIGLTFFALSASDTLICERAVFHGSRNDIRFKASQFALNLLRLYLLDMGSPGTETA